jgi:hypothetical protein
MHTQHHTTRRLTMKLTTLLCSLLSVGLLAGLVTGCATEKAEAAKLQAQAKVSKPEAERIALAKVPGGTIKSSELEKEKGKLVWSFDIATPGSKDITEILVDAVTGEVVSVETETPAKEERERSKESK